MSHVDGFDDGVGYGVFGSSYYRTGVYATSYHGRCVYAISYDGRGVDASSYTNVGVTGRSHYENGVYGQSVESHGVLGNSIYGVGVFATSTYGTGLYANSYLGKAAVLDGNVDIIGHLHKGGGSFKIDHPLDPANKYLSHSFVESPDMKNVYDGVVALGDKGEAEIELPIWFGSLNQDFRYLLTAIGAPGPNLYIAEEISNTTTKHGIDDDSGDDNNGNCFKIAGGIPGMKVSWQVTGIRKDPWANSHRIQVEEDKPDKERGHYLYPDLYGQPEEEGISHLLFPEEKLPGTTQASKP